MPHFENPEDQKKYDEVWSKLCIYEKTKNPYLYAMLLDEEIEAFNKANPDRMFYESPAYAAFDNHLATLFPFGNEAEQEFHLSVVKTVFENAAIRQLDYGKKVYDVKEQIENGELEGTEYMSLDPQ